MLDALALGFALAAGYARHVDDGLARLAALTGEADAGTDDDAAAPALLPEAATAFVSPAAIEVLDTPRWIRHRLRKDERLTQVAARYGVPTDKLAKWNRIDPNLPLGKRRTLRVLTDRVVPPPLRARYVVREGDDWDAVAAVFRVPEHELRVQNYRMRSPVVGATIVAWIDPIEGPWFVAPGEPAEQPPLELSSDGRSIGLPNKGKLVDAVQLPEHPLWVRGNPDHLWGSAHTIRQVHRAFAILRGHKGYASGVLIGAISRRKGGPMPPHRSHQSGRDVDIRLPLRAGTPKTKSPNADEVDWYATWALIESFVQTGEAEAVFVNEAHHGRLYEAARAMGVPRERVHEIVRWPAWRGSGEPIVQHADGHNAHLHVRIRCGTDEPACQ
ncbi:MAG: penicillin-insensitive murein endopeptidase [Deltaproteobacteria bacterium]|nr:penicillin-insensitive murein endopeptidase [Nannocystaceae bacterium]